MLKVIYNKFYLITFLLLIIISGCNCNKSRKNVDVSNISVDVDIKRFDKAIWAIDTLNIYKEVVNIYNEYPLFFPFYMQEVMRFGKFSATDSAEFIEPFNMHVTNKYVKEVLDTIQQAYPNLNEFDKELEQSLKYFKYYFPGMHVPEFISFPSNFTYAALSYDTLIIGIGMDMYLGANYKYYNGMFPAYLYNKFTKEYMLPNTLNVLATMHFNYPLTENTLLARMINEGKKVYFLDKLMPDYADHIKMGYLFDELEWCRENEAEVWNFFIENDLLYNTEAKQAENYLNPSPSTTGMPMESPGRVGIWVGWQIVRQFMKRNPNVKYKALINDYDAQTILSLSKYKPKT